MRECRRCRQQLAPLEVRMGYCVECATHPDVTDPMPGRVTDDQEGV